MKYMISTLAEGVFHEITEKNRFDCSMFWSILHTQFIAAGIYQDILSNVGTDTWKYNSDMDCATITFNTRSGAFIP